MKRVVIITLTSFLLFQISELYCQSAISQTFSYTGAMQTFTIPSCASSLTLDVYGASGGWGSSTPPTIGASFGGKVSAVMNATPGLILNLFVGGKGANAASTSTLTGLGGFNGGGNALPVYVIGYAFCGFLPSHGGAGGGASDVRINGSGLGDRILVAGGGGGCEYGTTIAGRGGGGSLCIGPTYIGMGGGSSNNISMGGCLGGPAISNGDLDGSGAGVNGPGLIANATGVVAGSNGSLGLGGNSGGLNTSTTNIIDGISCGAGGGGYYGGAGAGSIINPAGACGACCLQIISGGGGGGSSYANTTIFSNVSFSAGVRSTDGMIVIRYQSGNASVAQIASSSGTIFCGVGNSTLSLSGLSSYTWSTGSGNSSIIVSPTITSTYSLSGLSTGNCSVSSQITLSVIPLPSISITSTSNQICSGGTITLTASGAGSYTWNSGLQNSTIAVSPTISTQYTVTGLQNGCPGQGTYSVQVTPSITPTIITNAPVCSGDNLIIYAVGATNYLWSGPGISTLAQNSLNINNATTGASGIYTVAASTGQCSVAATRSITVYSLPTLAVVGEKMLCEGESLLLFATSFGTATYSWSLPSGTIYNGITYIATNVSTANSGSYTVTVQDANNCFASSAFNVTVQPAPVLSVNGNTALCQGEQTQVVLSGADNYSLANVPTPSVIVLSPTVTSIYHNTGTSLTSTCSATKIFSVIVSPCTNIQTILDTESSIRLYPTPNSGRLFISSFNSSEISIYNSTGELILQSMISSGENQLDIHYFPQGLYILKTSGNIKRSCTKFIKTD